MRVTRLGVVHGLDLVVVVALLLTVLLVPVAFLVPFNDEWLRINFLADHTVWQWTVLHWQTWVVRPTSEVIMGLAALPNTRPALEHDFTPAAFLSRFRQVYLVLALSYCALLWLNALLLRGKWRAREETTLVVLGVLTCWLTSEELGYGFYWIDGYGNVLMPFVFLTCGLTLLARSQKLVPLLGAGTLIVLAALGHETLCIYAIGVLGLCAVLRRPKLEGWTRWAVFVGLILVCGAILGAQLFSDGPRVRDENYMRATGGGYHYDIALQNVLQIKPLYALLCILSPVFAVAIYRDHVSEVLERATADFARNRVFWLLLVLGTWLTALLPLASVGLTKGRIIVSLYSTLTHLFFVLLGFLLCPVLDRVTERLMRGYRRRVGSVLPIVLLLVVTSGNRESFSQAVVRRAELEGQALAYMTQLFGAHKRLNLCRPDHPYVKRAKGLTDRGEAEYFRLEKVRHRCPKQRAAR